MALTPKRISYSIASAHRDSDTNLPIMPSSLANSVDYVHIDLWQGSGGVRSSESWGLRDLTQLPFDYHLFGVDHHEVLPQVCLRPGDRVALHPEDVDDITSVADALADANVNLGISISPHLAANDAIALIHSWSPDYIQIMTALPGYSGGLFQSERLLVLVEIAATFPSIPIQVDGGINGRVSQLLAFMPVESIVSGSFITNSEYPIHQVLRLRGIEPCSKLADFPLWKNTVRPGDDFNEVLAAINLSEVGGVAVTDDDNHFYGLITYYDLVQWTSKSGLEGRAGEIANRDCFVFPGERTWLEFLEHVGSKSRLPSLVPVVSAGGDFLGTVRVKDLVLPQDSARSSR